MKINAGNYLCFSNNNNHRRANIASDELAQSTLLIGENFLQLHPNNIKMLNILDMISSW